MGSPASTASPLPKPVKSTAVEVLDPGRAIRQWWKRKFKDGVEGVTIIQAIGDVGIMSMAHLAQRLCDEKTPAKVKDQIAMTMAPKLVAEVRGRVREGHKSGGHSDVSDLLEDYKVRT